MDLVRAAQLLEWEFEELVTLPAWKSVPCWKRRDLENVTRASINSMREAARAADTSQPERTAIAAVTPISRSELWESKPPRA